MQINTELHVRHRWKVGEEVTVYHVHRNQLDLFCAPTVKLDVEDFNRKVITNPLNRVVCEFLAQELDRVTPEDAYFLRQRCPPIW